MSFFLLLYFFVELLNVLQKKKKKVKIRQNRLKINNEKKNKEFAADISNDLFS
jgi:hypothetical protein